MSANDLFNWSDACKIGVREVDEQHQVIVSLLNQLHHAIGTQQGEAGAQAIVDRLNEYTRTHFQLEESLMRLTQYPDFESHCLSHTELVSQVQQLQARLDRGSATTALELLDLLKNWLTRHINETDRRFGDFFQTAGLHQYAAWSNEVQTTMKKKKWWKLW